MRSLFKAFVLLLDEALLVAIVLLVLWKVGVRLSPVVIISVVVALGVWLLVLYKIIVSIGRRRQVGGREGMIGLQGKVLKPLAPEGVIRVRGELWKASSVGDSIDTDEEVTIVGIERLRLLVKRRSDVR